MPNESLIIQFQHNPLLQFVKNQTVQVLSGVKSFAWYCFEWTLISPLRLFYMHGPTWQGMTPPDICAQLTNVEASWWLDSDHPERLETCQQRIDKQFNSFAISIGSVLYFSMLLIVVAWLSCRCFFVRPILNELRSLVSKSDQDKK
jgi:hypothetical protein